MVLGRVPDYSSLAISSVARCKPVAGRFSASRPTDQNLLRSGSVWRRVQTASLLRLRRYYFSDRWFLVWSIGASSGVLHLRVDKISPLS